MGDYQNTKPLWRLLRDGYNGETITEVACPKCGESIPKRFTAAGIPGGTFTCVECGTHFALPPVSRVQREDRPKVRVRGNGCDIAALVSMARRAAFAAGWTHEEWKRA